MHLVGVPPVEGQVRLLAGPCRVRGGGADGHGDDHAEHGRDQRDQGHGQFSGSQCFSSSTWVRRNGGWVGTAAGLRRAPARGPPVRVGARSRMERGRCVSRSLARGRRGHKDLVSKIYLVHPGPWRRRRRVSRERGIVGGRMGDDRTMPDRLSLRAIIGAPQPSAATVALALIERSRPLPPNSCEV